MWCMTSMYNQSQLFLNSVYNKRDNNVCNNKLQMQHVMLLSWVTFYMLKYFVLHISLQCSFVKSLFGIQKQMFLSFSLSTLKSLFYPMKINNRCWDIWVWAEKKSGLYLSPSGRWTAMRWWRRTGRHRAAVRCPDAPGKPWEVSAPPSAPPGSRWARLALVADRSLRTGSHPADRAVLSTYSVGHKYKCWTSCRMCWMFKANTAADGEWELMNLCNLTALLVLPCTKHVVVIESLFFTRSTWPLT